MNGNPKRPPWSQPLCQPCYIERFAAPCLVLSSWIKNEHCFDCGAVTATGIYTDIRPEEERPHGPDGAAGSLFSREVNEWIAAHGEYRGGVIPGSAEAPSAALGESK